MPCVRRRCGRETADRSDEISWRLFDVDPLGDLGQKRLECDILPDPSFFDEGLIPVMPPRSVRETDRNQREAEGLVEIAHGAILVRRRDDPNEPDAPMFQDKILTDPRDYGRADPPPHGSA